MSRSVRVYFDFVSPYSYLALTRLAAFGARHGVAWEPTPVFYAALLDANHLVGPAESRLHHRAARLEGRLPELSARAAVLDARPRAADRAAAPIRRETSAG